MAERQVDKRHVEPFILLGGVESGIERYVQRLSFTDSIGGRADEVTIELDNREGRFFAAPAYYPPGWLPGYGTELIVRIMAFEPEVGEPGELSLGIMEVDQVELTGFPHVAKIRAITAAMNTNLRRFKRSDNYVNMSLEDIGRKIAEKANIKYVYDAPSLPKYKRRVQKDKSDLLFLHELCDEAALECKVTNGQLVIFDRRRYEAKAPLAVLDFDDLGKTPWVHGYALSGIATEQYAACTVKYYDFESGKVHRATVANPTWTDGPTLEITRRCDSQAEAETIARNTLWRYRMEAMPATLTLTGSPALLAGVCLELKNVGEFAMKYMITRAGHDLLDGSGWRVTAEMEPVIDS